MISVSLAQIKTSLGNIKENAYKHFELIEKAIEDKYDLIVFPELSLTGYNLRDLVYNVSLNQESDIIKKIKDYSKYISIVTGFVYEDKRHLFYNASGYFEGGEILHIHKKVFLPNYTMFEESRYFAKGDSFTAFDTKYFRCGILICEDALHISSILSLTRQDVDTVIVVSNSPARGIFEDSFYPEELWYNTLKFAATNLTVNVIFVNRVGVEEGITFWGGSTVFSPFGKSILKLPLLKEEVKGVKIDLKELRRSRIHSPFLKGEDFAMIKKLVRNCGDADEY